jgi:alkanesulfonate monooxygenase SsuD/methylene tetrahydromethanopterin reductase-like flavin-dependent oxidoreductase (luciferase family)
VYADSLKGAKPDFDIVAGVQININDDLEQALLPVKMMLGFYIGGMGAKGQNFHTHLMSRFGYEKEALQIQEAFFAGRRDEAIALVPDEFADAISLCGSKERIRDRLQAWEDSPVSTILTMAPGLDGTRTIAEIILG